MNPLTLTAIQLAALFGVEVKPHLTDAAKVSIRGSELMVAAYLTASGMLAKLGKEGIEVQKGATYFWAHLPRAEFEAVAVPLPKGAEVAPIAVNVKPASA